MSPFQRQLEKGRSQCELAPSKLISQNLTNQNIVHRNLRQSNHIKMNVHYAFGTDQVGQTDLFCY